MPLNLPYYYGHSGEQYAFFRIPKLLLTDDRFAEISTDAKLLYGLLLDRMELSYRNGWIDEQNRVFIIFTAEEVMSTLRCRSEKAARLFSELDSAKGIGLELLVETVCAKRKTTRISGADFPHEIVRSRFLKLDSSHIEFVMDCLQKNTTQVHNIKQYLLAVLFNAPTTMNNHYTSLVNHDMHAGGW